MSPWRPQTAECFLLRATGSFNNRIKGKQGKKNPNGDTVGHIECSTVEPCGPVFFPDISWGITVTVLTESRQGNAVFPVASIHYVEQLSPPLLREEIHPRPFILEVFLLTL